MLSATRTSQYGISLLELMLASAIGTTLLAAMLAGFGYTTSNLHDHQQLLRGAGELRSVVALVVDDVRRSGSWNMAAPSAPYEPRVNPFQQADSRLRRVNADCLLYSYDINRNGELERYERRGFRLRGGAIEVRKAARGCAQSGWERITDPNVLRVTSLQFDIVKRPIDLPGMPPLQRLQVTLTVAATLPKAGDFEQFLRRTVTVANDHLLAPPAPEST